jgi:hypothetical protein
MKAIWEVAGAGAALTKGVADRLLIPPPSVPPLSFRTNRYGTLRPLLTPPQALPTTVAEPAAIHREGVAVDEPALIGVG